MIQSLFWRIFMNFVIHITGIVQGVGFRPFIYRAAAKFDLKGFVRNSGNIGVEIVVNGNQSSIEQFIQYIKENKPVISKIYSILVQKEETEKEFSEFVILPSIKSKGDSIVLPPDIAICEECLRDFRNPQIKRYYGYPFIACSECGPRFTTVKDLPYDRPLTTMIEFPFCKECLAEYSNPSDRRYHAQTFACSTCGPRYTLYDNDGTEFEGIKPFNTAAKLINEGHVLALMGIGGVHLVCIPTDEAVLKMRKRKRKRKYKPFAVMAPSIEKIRSFATITPNEEAILTSFRRPIVLLDKKKDFPLSKHISPGLNNIGAFLPYAGIHYLLFDNVDHPALIMTSGNRSNIPMAITRENVLEDLQEMADYFLLHDRKIYQRCDDSVLLMIQEKETIIRRSRGYVPEHVDTAFPVPELTVLALGPELHSTISVLKKGRIFPSQHVGDVTSLETLEFLKSTAKHFLHLLQIKKPQLIACDFNPVFNSTKLGFEFLERYGTNLVQVQHHHAHLCSLMNEHKISHDEEIMGILLDGVGLGDDRNGWGGEILLGTYADYRRLGQLEYHAMPGGDRCVYYPVRMMASILSKKYNSEELHERINQDYLDGLPHGVQELNVLINQLYDNAKVVQTSGMGRVLDALSALLGICYERTYEGEPAIRLDHKAQLGNPNKFKFELPVVKNKHEIIQTTPLLHKCLQLKQDSNSIVDIAASAIKCLSLAIADLAIEKALEKGIRKIGLSGGCSYNRLIVKTIKDRVEAHELTFLQHEKVPPGDAGISIGQAIHGAAYLTYF